MLCRTRSFAGDNFNAETVREIVGSFIDASALPAAPPRELPNKPHCPSCCVRHIAWCTVLGGFAFISLACCALGAGAPHAAVSLDRGAKFLDYLRTREHSDEPTWVYHGGLPAAGSCVANSPALKGFDFSRKEEVRQRRPAARAVPAVLDSSCALSGVLHLAYRPLYSTVL